MGMSTGGNKGGVQSDINVTPLIDVLLVLLIIFLLVMPIMMRNETLQVPKKLPPDQVVDNTMTQIVVLVGVDKSITYKENDKVDDSVTKMHDLSAKLRERLPVVNTGTEKVVFVDFDDAVVWADVVETMDTIRSVADDVEHDKIKVALKVREAKDADASQTP
jgi:biopolymer transport protein TolR